jgi:NDP-sugar pyrophosphorylase family protein
MLHRQVYGDGLKAVLLAAGHGRRLLPLTRTVPKILVDIAGRTLLDRQLEYLARNGVTRVIVTTHHLGESVASALRTGRLPVEARVSHEPSLSGTAGALRALAPELTSTFVVLYGDVLTTADLGAMARLHHRRRGAATIACYRERATADKGILRLGDRGRVTSFVEKGRTPGEPAWINAGLYILEPDVLRFIMGPSPDFGHDVFPLMLREGCALWGHPVEGHVIDVGTPERLAYARRVASAAD